jgi:uncharacterized membrane protein
MDFLQLGYSYIHTITILMIIGLKSDNSQNMQILTFFEKPRIPMMKSIPSNLEWTITDMPTTWNRDIPTTWNPQAKYNNWNQTHNNK